MESIINYILRNPQDYRFEKASKRTDVIPYQFSLANYAEHERFVSRYNYVSKLDDFINTHVLGQDLYKFTEWTNYSQTPENEAPALYGSKSYRKKYLKRYKYFKYEQTAQSYQSSHDDTILFCYHNTNLDKRKLYRAEYELDKKGEVESAYYTYYKPWFFLLHHSVKETRKGGKVSMYKYEDDPKTKLGLTLLHKYPEKDLMKIKFNSYFSFVFAFNKTYQERSSAIARSFVALPNSHFTWAEDFQRFFVDVRGKSRIAHGANGTFTPFAPNVQEVDPFNPGAAILEVDSDEAYEPECLVSETAPENTKFWPRSKLKNQENHFQNLELRDQIFKYYYLDDGFSVKYNIVDSIENCEDYTWRWTYKQKRQNEWYFTHWARRVYHKLFMHPVYCGNVIVKLDEQQRRMLNLWIYFFFFLILIIYGNRLLKDYWTNVTFFDNKPHSINDLEKNFLPRNVSNVAQSHIWFLDNYPIYLNIMPDNYFKTHTLTLHPATYKAALNKYSTDSYIYFAQNPMSWGASFKGINKVQNNYYGSHQSLLDNKTLIFNSKDRYAWEGYIPRRKLLSLPYFYNLLNERRGSFLDLRGLSSSWPVYYYHRVADGRITSLTHQYHLDIAGSIYRLGARYTNPDIDSGLYHNFRALHPGLHKDLMRYGIMYARLQEKYYFSSFKLQVVKLYRPQFRSLSWRFDEAWHPYNVARPFRQDQMFTTWRTRGRWQKHEAASRKGHWWLNGTHRYSFHNRLYYRDYMYMNYSPTQQTQKVTRAKNPLKKLIKYGYDVHNTGLLNNGYGIVPSFLNFRLNDSGTLTVDNWLSKIRPLLHRHSTYYNIFQQLEKGPPWKDYLEIKRFFNNMVHYDKNYLYSTRGSYLKKEFLPHNLPSKIDNGKISYYHMGNIDEDKVYLLEQYIRPKTRRKIKKKLYKVIHTMESFIPESNLPELFSRTSLLDPMADGVIFRAGRDTRYPHPRIKKMLRKTKALMGTDYFSFSESIEKKLLSPDSSYFHPQADMFVRYPHMIADIFLLRQYEYLNFRAKLFSNIGRSKICMKKILQLYEEDVYNLF